MTFLVGCLNRFYGLLLQLYPPEFRAEFAAEMQTVFAERMGDAAGESPGALLTACARELWDLPRVLLRERGAAFRERRWRNMVGIQEVKKGFDDYYDNRYTDPGDGHETWRHTLLVSSPLVLIGAGSVFATYLPYDLWQVVFGVGMILLLFGVLGVAWLQRFPRWSYPYILPLPGVAVLGLVMAVVTGELINLFVTGVFGVTVGLAIGWSRSLRPLRQLVTGIWQDWTLLAFSLYGLLPLGVSIIFDDAHANNQTPYYALAVSAGVLAALLYLRSPRTWQRMAVLLGGVTLVVLMGLLDRVHFIGSQAYTYQASGWMFHVWLLLTCLIAAPALTVGVSRFLVEHRRSA